jgi:hypothetical protein
MIAHAARPERVEAVRNVDAEPCRPMLQANPLNLHKLRGKRTNNVAPSIYSSVSMSARGRRPIALDRTGQHLYKALPNDEAKVRALITNSTHTRPAWRHPRTTRDTCPRRVS